MAKGAQVRSLVVPEKVAYSVAFNPKGDLLATGGDDKLIRYWNVADGKELRKSQGHGASVYAVAFSPDGTKLASGSVDKTIRIWNVADGKELHKLDGHPDDIYAIAFSPNGSRLASVGYGGNIYVWDVAGAKPLFHQHVAPYTMTYGVAWSPDGSQLAVAASDNNVYLLETAVMGRGRRWALLLGGLAQFRGATALSEANVYTARREPRTPGIAKTRLEEIDYEQET